METSQEIIEQQLPHYVMPDELEKAIAEAKAGRQHHARGTLTIALREIYLDLYCYTDEKELREWLDEFAATGTYYYMISKIAQDQHKWHVCELIDNVHDLVRTIRDADQAELTTRTAANQE